jgi:CheY-like chemotaxis protein
MRGGFMLDEEEMSVTAKHDQVKTVLVVEDDEDSSLVFTEAFALLTSYHVQAVKSGQEALTVVKHIKPDVFILDFRLPQTNGIDLYDQLHAIPGLEHVPGIIISGVASEKIASEIESRKLICIDKPFDLDDFLDAVKQALG